MPAASIWILTSSFRGSPISISSIDHGWLNSQISAPFVFMKDLQRNALTRVSVKGTGLGRMAI